LRHPNNSSHLSLNKEGSCDYPNKVVELKERYWETAKSTPLIILKKLLLEHLSIKKLLEML